MNGTIARAFELKATKSINLVMEYILKHENKQIYNNVIMLDIRKIIEERNFDL